MATTATRSANTLYLEASGGASTIDALTAKNIVVTHIILTAGAAAEVLTLRDVSTTNVKMVVTAPANTTVSIPNGEMEILFPNGIRVTLTQTTSFATLIIKESRA